MARGGASGFGGLGRDRKGDPREGEGTQLGREGGRSVTQTVPLPKAARVPQVDGVRTGPSGEGLLVDCPHAAACAGCPLIDQDYVRQLATKRARVVGAASHYPGLELVYTRPVEAAEPIVGYRARAKLIVSPTGEIGLFDRSGDHVVVDIPGCRVLAPALADVANALRALVASPSLEAAALLRPFGASREGALRAVDLREVRPHGLGGEPSVLVAFVLHRDRAAPRDELRAAGRAIRPLLPRVMGVAANLHDGDTPQVLGSETLLLDGVGHVEDRIGPAYHFATFGSFVQAHRGQAERVHAFIAREVAPLEASPAAAPRGAAAQDATADASARRVSSSGPRSLRVLDLYGGSGAISLSLATMGNAVTMVESFPPAAQSARLAAEAQGLRTLDVRAGDAADVAAALSASGARFDAIVMNPPRRGVSPGVREAVSRLGAPLLVYVSCDPDTLARDLDHFGRLGYAPGELAPLDMIPLTEEVETVTVLRRSPLPPPRVLYEDDDLVVVDKAAHEPVEAHAEYTSSLLARSTGLCAGGPLHLIHRSEAGTSGLCMLARSEAARALWSSALESAGRLVYVVAAKGVTPAKGAITRELREGGRAVPARTRYRRLAVASGHSVLRVIPDGGRTHQVRRHFAAIGHSVLGDERYGHAPTNRYFEEKHGLDRTFIHLVRIEITHPRTGMRLFIESTLSGDLRATLERAGGGPAVLRFLEQKHALGDGRTSSIPPPLDEPPRPAGGLLPPPVEGRDVMPSSVPPSWAPPSGPPSSMPPSAPLSGIMPSGLPGPELEDSPRTIRAPLLGSDDE